MASKLTAFEDEILRMVLVGRSYAAIGKFLVEEKGCRADGPSVYRWLKSRQRKLLARQALVHPTTVQIAVSKDPFETPSNPVYAAATQAIVPVDVPNKAFRLSPEGQANSASEFDKLMLETTEKKSILLKKR